MEEKKVLVISNDKIKKPFQSYDISEYSELFIDGSYFPLQILDGLKDKITIEKNRNLKPLIKNEEMYKNFEKEDIFLTSENKKDLETILTHINYYRLSVYRLYLGNKERNFNNIFKLYLFDTELRELISNALPAIENSLKATLAYSLALNYKESSDNHSCHEALCYLDCDVVYKKDKVQNGNVKAMLSGFSDLLNRKQDKDPMVTHHLKMYGGNIPIWVLVEFLTLGDIYTLSIYLDRSYRKKWAQQLFGNIRDEWICNWIKTIQQLRNSCAHNARLYGSKPTYNPAIVDEERNLIKGCINIKESDYYIDNELTHSVFAGILTMKKFYTTNPIMHNKWIAFVNNIESIINKYEIDEEFIGFIDGWKDILLYGIAQ